MVYIAIIHTAKIVPEFFSYPLIASICKETIAPYQMFVAICKETVAPYQMFVATCKETVVP